MIIKLGVGVEINFNPYSQRADMESSPTVRGKRVGVDSISTQRSTAFNGSEAYPQAGVATPYETTLQTTVYKRYTQLLPISIKHITLIYRTLLKRIHLTTTYLYSHL